MERKFKAIPGVEKVKVNHATGKSELYLSGEVKLEELQQAISEDGYRVVTWAERNQESAVAPEGRGKYLEIGAIALVIMALYLVLKKFSLLPQGFGVSDSMSYGFVFLIGLVAAVSTCLAVSGGLLLAISAKYNESHPGLSGAQKFKPHLYFNLGRIISYTGLGAVVGALGGVLTLSTRLNGIITIIVSLVMILLGFQLLKIFPGLKRFQPKMPKSLAHKIHDWSAAENKVGPFFLGALTFFLPCGFTQALQLYTLSRGDAWVGALTMLAFSLGTLPALLSVGALSSFSGGAFHRGFLKFAGVLVIILGLFNINSGLTLAGFRINLAGLTQSSSKTNQSKNPGAEIINGKQIAKMKIVGLSYYPSRFTVKAGIPVEWEIDGSQAAGCARVIVASALGINEYLPASGTKKITFTPRKTGTIAFSCPMGMTTRGAGFVVVAE